MKIASYNTEISPVYQVDWACQEIGKRIASSKRRIVWKFGIANATKHLEGALGVACRGEEHELIVDWSLRSGKRSVLFDGENVHSSVEPYSTKFEEVLTIGEHTIKIVCIANIPVFPATDFRQYDMILDGRSYFDMPCIFELGMKHEGNTMPEFPYKDFAHLSEPTLPIQSHHMLNRHDGYLSDSIHSDVAVIDLLEYDLEGQVGSALIRNVVADFRDSPPRQELVQEDKAMLPNEDEEYYDSPDTMPTFLAFADPKGPQGAQDHLDHNLRYVV